MTALAQRIFGFRALSYSACACLFGLGCISGTVPANAQTSLPSNAEITKSAPNAFAPISGYTVPFISGKGHGGPVVRLRLNDKLDADFLVDTGANYNFIHPRVVKALGLTATPLPKADGSPSTPPGTPTEMIHVERVRSGAMLIESPQFLVSEYGTDGIAGRALDGIIGKNILQMFAVLFDFENNRLLLLPGGKLDNKQLAYLRVTGGTMSEIPTGSSPNQGLPTTVPSQIEVNKHTATFPFVVDTGSPITLVYDPKNAMQLPKTINAVPITQTVVARPWNYYVFPVTSIAAGERIPDGKQNRLVPFECGLTLEDGNSSILGLNYLSHFRVLIDYPAERMYLTPVTNPRNRPFPTESSRQCATLTFADLLIVPWADGTYTVRQTDKDREFGKAGVQSSDILETINGKKPDGLLRNSMTALFMESGDKPAVLRLRRDGKLIEVKVDLMPKK